MNSAELIVGVEDGGGGLDACDRAVQRRWGSGSADERRVKRESKRS